VATSQSWRRTKYVTLGVEGSAAESEQVIVLVSQVAHDPSGSCKKLTVSMGLQEQNAKTTMNLTSGW